MGPAGSPGAVAGGCVSGLLSRLRSVSTVQRWLPWSPGLRVTTHDCRSLSLFSRPCSHVFQSESPSEGGESEEF